MIGAKLGLDFADFIVYNTPLVFILLPLASWLLYRRFKDEIDGRAECDLEAMRAKNKILSPYMLAKVSAVGFTIVLALFLSPWHKQEAAWFTFLGMMFVCMLVNAHEIHSVMEAIEFDVLLFFAALFVLVETLGELGVIRTLGGGLADIIKSVDIDNRLTVAMILMLWVSGLGSAFLESLPYTTTVCYLLLNLE